MLLKKPNVVQIKSKQEYKPMEDFTDIERLSQKNDSSLFVFGDSNKKRKTALIFGRCFNYQVLDMIEFDVKEHSPMNASSKFESGFGHKPCIVFQGDLFVNNEDFKMIANVFLDFFKGKPVDKIHLLGLEHVIIITAISEEIIHFGRYSIQYTKNSENIQTPNVELVEIGPIMEMKVCRHKWGSDDTRRIAHKVPYELRHSKDRNKNVEKDELGNTVGRVHIEQQDIETAALRKYKALKKTNKRAAKDLLEQTKKTFDLREKLNSRIESSESLDDRMVDE